MWRHGHPYQKLGSEKPLADSVESIFGAYLVTGGEKMAAQVDLTLKFLIY